MADLHPDDPHTSLLVTLLSQVEDLEQRHRRDPQRSAANLAESVGDTAILVLRRVLAAYPDANPPR
jgi:hypothetical protein